MEAMLNVSLRRIAFLIAFIGFICCLNAAEFTLPQDAAGIKDLSELGAQYLPAGYNTSNVTFADFQRLLRDKCQQANSDLPAHQVNAAKLSDNIEKAGMNLMECVSGLVNITAVMEEVEDAKPKGDLDVVFEKYCLRLPNMTRCLSDFNDALLPCMTSEERTHNTMIRRIMDKLLEFVCYKNGDQIALFIAEQGPECFEQHRDNMANCMQKSFGHYLPKQLNISKVELPQLVLGPRQCTELHDFEECWVRHLETCTNITPSNIVESMFRYIRRESHCQKTINRGTRESNANFAIRSGAVSPTSWNSAAATAVFSLPLALVLRMI